MKKPLIFLMFTFSLLLIFSAAVLAEEGSLTGGTYTFTDREGNTVTAPVNAFAYRVIEFIHGDPWRNADTNTDPLIALGLPDASDSNNSTGDLCLGKNGVLVLAFDTPIYDGEGNDIYVFEVGSDVESTKVEVSSDLVTWYEIGVAKGRTAGLDFTGKIPVGASFRYVRLTDTGDNGNSGGWPGADIDTVCGLNTKPIPETAETNSLIFRNIKISIDGTPIQPTDANGNPVEPFIINGTTYLPLRAVSGALGCSVEWEDFTSTITLTSGKAPVIRPYAGFGHSAIETANVLFRGIRIILDGKQIIPKDVNGSVLDPFIKDGTTYLPVRALASALGFDVSWDDETSTVFIKS